jgi:hypothetical protein
MLVNSNLELMHFVQCCHACQGFTVRARSYTRWYAGPLEFHRNSLLNLAEAMRRTRKLCATVIDTMGRELMIRGQWQVGDGQSTVSPS